MGLNIPGAKVGISLSKNIQGSCNDSREVYMGSPNPPIHTYLLRAFPFECFMHLNIKMMIVQMYTAQLSRVSDFIIIICELCRGE